MVLWSRVMKKKITQDKNKIFVPAFNKVRTFSLTPGGACEKPSSPQAVADLPPLLKTKIRPNNQSQFPEKMEEDTPLTSSCTRCIACWAPQSVPDSQFTPSEMPLKGQCSHITLSPRKVGEKKLERKHDKENATVRELPFSSVANAVISLKSTKWAERRWWQKPCNTDFSL